MLLPAILFFWALGTTLVGCAMAIMVKKEKLQPFSFYDCLFSADDSWVTDCSSCYCSCWLVLGPRPFFFFFFLCIFFFLVGMAFNRKCILFVWLRIGNGDERGNILDMMSRQYSFRRSYTAGESYDVKFDHDYLNKICRLPLWLITLYSVIVNSHFREL